MALRQTRKRSADLMDHGDQATTPTGSPVHKKPKITQAQKQALMDNLQLEITERARKLRAHYALQCSDLRSRIERRVNRIPMNLRKAKMGELFEKHSATLPSDLERNAVMKDRAEPMPRTLELDRPLPALPQKLNSKLPSPMRPIETRTLSATKGKKRKSSEMIIAIDKENNLDHNAGPDNLSVMKNSKRVKTGPAPRAVSRTTKTASVLSPKSHNSRTLPQSPIKDQKLAPSSPNKPSYIARPVSPLKPASPLKAAASAATSAISASIHGMMEHTKRGTTATAAKLTRTTSQEKSNAVAAKGRMLPPPRPATTTGPAAMERGRATSQLSNHSASSSTSTTSTTTVVKKSSKAEGSKTTVKGSTTKNGTAAPKTAMRKNTAISAAGKKVVVAEPAAGRRVLRKRT